MKASITYISNKLNSNIELKNDYCPSPLLNIHKHDACEIILVKCGSLNILIGQQIVTLHQGNILFIAGNVPHRHLQDQECLPIPQVDILYFSIQLLPPQRLELAEFRNVHRLMETSKQGIVYSQQELFQTINSELELLQKNKELDRIISLYKILQFLSKHKGDLVSSITYCKEISYLEASDPTILIVSFLNKNYTQEISLEMLARKVGLNKTALCKHFKKSTGTTIFNMLQRIRIENACRLLIETNLTIAQVAVKVGYRNISVFNEQFKKVVSTSPSNFRANIINFNNTI